MIILRVIILFLAYVGIMALIVYFLDLRWATSLITFLIGAIVIWEFLVSRFSLPVKVEPVPSNELEKGEFAFYVKNTTGGAISAGNKVGVGPRKLTMIDKEGNKYHYPYVEHYPPRPFIRYLDTGDRRILRKKPGLPWGALYCETPASLEPGWKGLWATYLDPHGLDSKKKISTFRSVAPAVYDMTKPFYHYANQGTGTVFSPGDFYENTERIYEDVLGEKPKVDLAFKAQFEEPIPGIIPTEVENHIDHLTKEITKAVFPNIKVSGSIERIEVELKNIRTFNFIKKNSEWKEENFYDQIRKNMSKVIKRFKSL